MGVFRYPRKGLYADRVVYETQTVSAESDRPRTLHFELPLFKFFLRNTNDSSSRKSSHNESSAPSMNFNAPSVAILGCTAI